MKKPKANTKTSSPPPGKRFDELGELQQAILEVLWTLKEATVQEVREHLHREKIPAYTTVLSLLQKLEKNGWVTHRSDGRTYIYSPAISHAKERSRSLSAFVDRLFGGDPTRLFEHLLDDPRVSVDEITTIRKLIRAKQGRDKS